MSEMADILNIRGEPIFDDRVVKLKLTRTIRTPTQRLDIATR